MKKGIGLEFLFSGNNHGKKAAESIEKFLKNKDHWDADIAKTRMTVKKLLSTIENKNGDGKEITEVDYVDAYFVGEFKTVKRDLDNLTHIFKSSNTLQFCNQLFKVVKEEMRLLSEGGRLEDVENKINRLYESSRWHGDDGWWEFRLPTNNNIYYIWADADKNHPVAEFSWNDDASRDWVRKVDSGLNITLSFDEMKSALEKCLGLLDAVEVFIDNFNHAAADYQKILNMYRLSAKDVNDKDAGAIISWLESGFSFRNELVSHALGFVNSIHHYIKKSI